jgi:hypothetical protein
MHRHLQILLLLICGTPLVAIAMASSVTDQVIDMTSGGYAIIALIIFTCAYALVISEEFLHLRKSRPVIM